MEFATERQDGDLDVIVWERGVGRTQACGTGAAATVVAARARGLSTSGRVHLPGGSLDIDLRDAGEVFMTGSARYVFSGWLEAIS